LEEQKSVLSEEVSSYKNMKLKPWRMWFRRSFFKNSMKAHPHHWAKEA